MFARFPLLFIGLVAGAVLVSDQPVFPSATLAALVLTMSAPITVALMASIDWAPVAAGYLGSVVLLLGYVSIRACVLARTEHRLVACVFTAAACLALYAIDNRFDTIARGVVDLRDLLYYLSVAAMFATLACALRRTRRRVIATLGTCTIVLLVANLIMAPVTGCRVDMTSGQRQTLTSVTRHTLRQLDADVHIRAYLSEHSHEALEVLLPRVRDTLREYDLVGGDRLHVSIDKPSLDEASMLQLNERYGVTAFPLEQRAGRRAGKAYFAIVVVSGDQHETLDLLELTTRTKRPDGYVAVELHNIEYSVTRAIQRVTRKGRSVDALLRALDTPVTLTLYKSPAPTPTQLEGFSASLSRVGRRLIASSPRLFTYREQLVDSADQEKRLLDWGVKPMQVSDTRAAYFHPVLRVGKSDPRLILPEPSTRDARIRVLLRHELERAIRSRQLIGIHGAGSDRLRAQLALNYLVQPTPLVKPLPPDMAVLVVVAPEQLDDGARRVIDQFVMRGGTLIVFASAFRMKPDKGLALSRLRSPVTELLATYGVRVHDTIVLDQRADTFRFPIVEPGGTKAELTDLTYPLFVVVPPSQRRGSTPFGRNVDDVVVPWASPISVADGARALAVLSSSADSWVQETAAALPDTKKYPGPGFASRPGDSAKGPFTLAAVLAGPFVSHFDRSKRSSDAARLLVVGSADFVSDYGQLTGKQLATSRRYLNNVVFIHDAIDWALSDGRLLEIRDRPRPPDLDVAAGNGGVWQAAGFAVLGGLVLLILGWRKLTDGLILRA